MRKTHRGLARGFHERLVHRDLRRSRRSRTSTSKIIAHDSTQDEPRCPYRALHRAANFGLSNARVVAHRDFHDTKSRDVPFHDHFHRPAVGSLFKGEGAQHICAPGAKWTEVTDLHAVQKPDQAGSEAIAE